MSTTVPLAGSEADAIVVGPAVGVGVVGEHVDRRRGGILENGRRVVHRRRRVVDAGDRDRDGRGRAAVQGVGERVRRRAGRCVAVVRIRLIGQPRAAHGDDDRAVRRIRRRPDQLQAAIWIGVVRQHVDRGRRGVLGHSRGVVDRDRRVVHAGDRDRDGRRRAAVERVGEAVRAAEVRGRLVRQAGAAAGDHDRAVRRLGDRVDRHRAAVDVGVVREHVDRRRAGVLGHRRACRRPRPARRRRR